MKNEKTEVRKHNKSLKLNTCLDKILESHDPNKNQTIFAISTDSSKPTEIQGL